jgi:lipopolysaccharide/colanic/teichoic acid biosynthesis glycosyltransferase
VDKALAVGMLLVAAPVALVAVLAMTVDILFVRRDRGPYLHRERRISRGRVFELLKLRTLRVDALARLGADDYVGLLEADTGNLTRSGRVIKRFYLDELPQLVNVLRGDISIVGPRPWPVAMVKEQVASGLDYRNHVRAGWTGPAQISKGSEGPLSYADLDLDYVRRCRTAGSLRLVRYDLGVMLKTIGVMVRGQGLRF